MFVFEIRVSSFKGESFNFINIVSNILKLRLTFFESGVT